jgi:hypothetical protein
MEDKTAKVTGYRVLSQEEINLMNEVKHLANSVGVLVDKLNNLPESPDNRLIDRRWVSLGADDLQKGFMSLVRSIAQPNSF